MGTDEEVGTLKRLEDNLSWNLLQYTVEKLWNAEPHDRLAVLESILGERPLPYRQRRHIGSLAVRIVSIMGSHDETVERR